jgi:formate hydrogenlyase subunit 4
MAIANALALQGAQALVVLLTAPLLTGIVRKTKARLLRRRGPSVFQPYRDFLRLLQKESVVAESASWLFFAAPYLIFAFTWVAATFVPTFVVDLPLEFAADLLTIFGLLAAARFLLALAGLDVGTSFGGIGASREVMIASLAEPVMLAIIFSLALIAGSTQIPAIAAFAGSPAVGLRISLALALIGLIMIAIAENGRVPIDNPATHLELTMVHEAMVLEYSGRHLALIEAAASLKLLTYVSLLSSVFLPWNLVHAGQSVSGLASAGGIYLGKVISSGVLLGIFEVSVAKMRVFRVPEFLMAALMLAMLAIVLGLVSQSL